MSEDLDYFGVAGRASLLISQHRPADAESLLRDALSRHPDAALLFHLLARCCSLQQKHEEARSLIRRTLELEPDDASNHAAHAGILQDLGRLEEAEAALDAALRPDPDLQEGWCLRARLRLTQRRWADAEAAARRGLALEADDEVAGSLLAVALRMQGRAEETRQQAAGLLSEHPESDLAHCNMGWTCLHDGRPAEAERHFLEALRLDPLYADARAGLLEAFKSRSPFYRAVQAWGLKMAQLGQRTEWLIAALVLVLLFTRSSWGKSHPILSALFYLGFMVLVVANQLTEALGHLVVLLDRRARRALTRAERWEASLLGALGVASVVYLIAGYALGRRSLVLGGWGLFGLTMPLAHVFTNESPAGRRIFIGLACAVAVGMLLVIYRAWLPWPWLDRVGFYALAGGMIAALALAGNPRFNR